VQVLRKHLPTPKPGKANVVLEVASGTGQHSAHFATGLPGFIFQVCLSPIAPNPNPRTRVIKSDSCATLWVLRWREVVDRVRGSVHTQPTEYTGCPGPSAPAQLISTALVRSLPCGSSDVSTTSREKR
jgi:hypothetical protein